MQNKTLRKIKYSLALVLTSICLAGCASGGGEMPAPPGNSSSGNSNVSTPANSSSSGKKEETPAVQTPQKGTRDNSIRCLVPLQDGINAINGDVATIDYSHASDGYVSVKYFGTNPTIKLRITGPDEVVYTYDLKTNDFEVFPLTGGNGDYTIAVYENIEGTQYAVAMSEIIPVEITDELTPYLYPNQYVWFNEKSACVKKAEELVYSANSDIDAVALVYDYMITNITYDTAKAESKPVNYVPDVDEILSKKTGICLDYASLMCSMLRSQGIPTRLEIGYAADAYHAWISVHIEDVGWVNGVIEFTGDTWELMDPTFGASTNDATLKKFIGDGTNYTLQKIY